MFGLGGLNSTDVGSRYYNGSGSNGDRSQRSRTNFFGPWFDFAAYRKRISIDPRLQEGYPQRLYIKTLIDQRESYVVYVDTDLNVRWAAQHQPNSNVFNLLFARVRDLDLANTLLDDRTFKYQFSHIVAHCVAGIIADEPFEITEARIQKAEKMILFFEQKALDFSGGYIHKAVSYQEQIAIECQENRVNTKLIEVIDKMAEKERTSYDLRGAKFGSGFASEGGFQCGGVLLDASSSANLTEAAEQIQELLQQLQIQGMTIEEAQQQAAKDLAKQAENNPTVMGKLVQWGKSLADTAGKTTVSEAAKGVVKLALQMAGIPLP